MRSMSASRRGLLRTVSAATVLLTSVAVVPLACSGFPFPPGYVAGPVSGVPATCEGDAYLAVPSGDCPASSCQGPVAFAVCDGTSFSGCTCSQPPGVLVPGLDAREGSRSSSSGSGCAPATCRGSGCSSGFTCSPGVDCSRSSCSSFDSSSSGSDDGAGDGPLFDVGDKGDCKGQVAERVSGAECPTCTLQYAYLLCDGIFYSSCSCALPAGYELVDASADGG
jgi:hypothetical protein